MPLSVAGTAEPMTRGWIAVGVLVVIGVSLRAVRLAGVYGREALAAHHVLGDRDGFQVRGVDTPSIPAEVVDGHSFGDRPDELDVAQSVCQIRRPLPTAQAAVPVRVQRPIPDPAPLDGDAGEQDLPHPWSGRTSGGIPILLALEAVASPPGEAEIVARVGVPLRTVCPDALCNSHFDRLPRRDSRCRGRSGRPGAG